MPVVSIANFANGQLLLVPDNITRWTSCLCSESHNNRQIFILSAVGKYRQGKSALLNLTVRFLTAKASKRDSSFPALASWCQYPSDERFKTSGEEEGCTKGIQVEIDPWIITDHNKKEYAVFIMDTQGLSDPESGSTEIDSGLFLLANLFSSITILNLFRQLDLEAFSLLTLFANLANKFKEDLGVDTRNILRDLVILIRDQELGNEVYGWEEGQRNLEKRFGQLAKHEQNANIPKILHQTYRDMSCFLMPKPADVKTVISENVDDIFMQHAHKLLVDIFGKKYLRPFVQNENELNCSGFAQHLENVVRLFKDNKLPKGEDLLTVLRRNELGNVVAAALKSYESEMYSGVKGSFLSEQQLLDLHETCLKKCKTTGTKNSALLTSEDVITKEVVKQLDSDLLKIYEMFQEINSGRLKQREKLLQLEHENNEKTEQGKRYQAEVSAQNQRLEILEKEKKNATSQEEFLRLQALCESIMEEQRAMTDKYRDDIANGNERVYALMAAQIKQQEARAEKEAELNRILIQRLSERSESTCSIM